MLVKWVRSGSDGAEVVNWEEDPPQPKRFFVFSRRYAADFNIPAVTRPFTDWALAAFATIEARALRIMVFPGGLCWRYLALPWMESTLRMVSGSETQSFHLVSVEVS